VVVRGVHPRLTQCGGGFVRQSAYMEGAAAHRLEALIFGIFMLGYKVAGGATMTGDGDRFALRDFLIAAKMFGEFGGGDLDHGKTCKLHKLCILLDLRVWSMGISGLMTPKAVRNLGEAVDALAGYKQLTEGAFILKTVTEIKWQTGEPRFSFDQDSCDHELRLYG